MSHVTIKKWFLKAYSQLGIFEIDITPVDFIKTYKNVEQAVKV